MEKQVNLTAKEKFETWIEEEKKKGLIDIKLSTEVTDDTSVEDLFAELIDMNYARESNRFEKIYDL